MVWGEKVAIYVRKCLVFPFYYSFSSQNPIFFISAGSYRAAMTIWSERRGEKEIVLSKGMEVNTVSVRESYSFNTRGPFDLWENKCYRELWINEEKAKYSFFHLPLVHRIVDKCPFASSAFTDVTFLVAPAMRSLSMMQRLSGACCLKQRLDGGWVCVLQPRKLQSGGTEHRASRTLACCLQAPCRLLPQLSKMLAVPINCLLTILLCSFPV